MPHWMPYDPWHVLWPMASPVAHGTSCAHGMSSHVLHNYLPMARAMDLAIPMAMAMHVALGIGARAGELRATTSATNGRSSETNSRASSTSAGPSGTGARTSDTSAGTCETNARTIDSNAITIETKEIAIETNTITIETNARTNETNERTNDAYVQVVTQHMVWAFACLVAHGMSHSQWHAL